VGLFYDSKTAREMQAKCASLSFGAPQSHMFSVPHLIIIFAVALMVFGPEKLPELARTLGKVMGEFRRATGDLRSTFEGHMRELEREAELRRVREAQPPAQSIGGGSPAPVLPVSTPAASAEGASSAGALSEDPQPPAPGTVPTEAPNAFAARDLPEPKQVQFETRELPQGAQADQAPAATADSPAAAEPDPDPEKVSDGRTRPA
jgi:TatA/E family protein of Tat protein translocase